MGTQPIPIVFAGFLIEGLSTSKDLKTKKGTWQVYIFIFKYIDMCMVSVEATRL